MIFQKLNVLAGIVEDVRCNLTIGTFAWVLHRLTGLALVIYLFLHFWALGAAVDGAAAFNARMSLFHTGLFMFFESLIVAIVVFHTFNGLRIIAIDFIGLNSLQKKFFQIAMSGTITVMVISGWMFFDRVFG